MIGKETTEVRPATLSEVTKILEGRQGTAGEFGFEQQTSLEYARRFGRLKITDAKEMEKALETLGLKPEVAVKVTDLLPVNKSQLMLILAKDRTELSDKKLSELGEIVAKFAKKAKKLDLEVAKEAVPEAPVEAAPTEAAPPEKKEEKKE